MTASVDRKHHCLHTLPVLVIHHKNVVDTHLKHLTEVLLMSTHSKLRWFLWVPGGGRVVWCHLSCITGAFNWYWLTVGQGLLFLVADKVEGECFYFFCFFTFIIVPLSSLSLSFISSTVSSISFLTFSGRWHKMTHKGWRVFKPQHNNVMSTHSMFLCRNKQKI